MKNEADYRDGLVEGQHGVKLVSRGTDGIEWAIGEFATIDEDMVDCEECDIQAVSNSTNY